MITTGTFPKALEGGNVKGKTKQGKTAKPPTPAKVTDKQPPQGMVSPKRQLAMDGNTPKC